MAQSKGTEFLREDFRPISHRNMPQTKNFPMWCHNQSLHFILNKHTKTIKT